MMKKIIIATTLLSAFFSLSQTDVYFEDFQNGTLSTFTIVDNDSLQPNTQVDEYVDAWISIYDPFDLSNSNQVASSTSYFEPTGQADCWLITPEIDLGEFGNIASWKAQSHDPSFPDDYYVLISQTDTQLSSFTDTLAYVYGEIADSLHLNEANISALGFNNQTIHLAFVNRTNNGFKLYLDDIRIVKDDPAYLAERITTKVTINPNPTSDFINIKGLVSIDNIQIISLDGKILIESTDSRIDITNLNDGKYLCFIDADNRISRATIIKN